MAAACPRTGIADLEERGILQLGRGKVISKKDLAASPGAYPVYSSAKENDGKFGEYGEYMFDEELITWSVDGGGRLFHRPKHRFSITNVGGFVRILDTEKVDCRYLYFVLTYLHSQVRFDWVRKAHPSVIRKVYTDFPLPSLAEQKRIVAVLDQAFAALDRACANAEANLADAKELFPSILGEAFKPEAPWPIISISDLIAGEVIERPIDGNHGETHPKKADFVDTGVPFIMASDLHDGLVDQEDCYFITREQADALRKGFAKHGDVLLSHKGTIGRTAILTTSLDYVMLTPQVTYYRVINPSRLDHEFLFYCFQSADFQKQMQEIAGIGATRAYIGITRQHDLRLPLPAIEDQKTLVTKFKAARAKSRPLLEGYQIALSDLDDLRQSILHKAFAGS